jgi:hypothetical protein
MGGTAARPSTLGGHLRPIEHPREYLTGLQCAWQFQSPKSLTAKAAPVSRRINNAGDTGIAGHAWNTGSTRQS